MKTSHATVTAALFAGVLGFHSPVSFAALADYGLISGAGALGIATDWTNDTTEVSVIGSGFTSSAQTDFGINQATSGTTTNTLAYAGSLWWDQYTISGGSGTGSASFSAALDGGLTSSGFAGAGVGYVLAVSSTLPTSFDIDFSTLTVSNTSSWLNSQLDAFNTPGGTNVLAYYVDSVSGNSIKAIDQLFAGSFDFTYDTPFYIGAALLTGAGGDSGTANFFNTATFNIGLSSGDTLVVASVPEPGEWAMLLAGLGLIGLRLRARRRPMVG